MVEKVINPQTLLFRDAQILIEEGWRLVITDMPVTMAVLLSLVSLNLTEVSIYRKDTL